MDYNDNAAPISWTAFIAAHVGAGLMMYGVMWVLTALADTGAV